MPEWGDERRWSPDAFEAAAERASALWALGQLLDKCPDAIKDVATLLATVLQEKPLVLFGRPGVTNWMALLLRALLRPYQWLHTFFPAAFPAALAKLVPMEDCSLPMIVVLKERPTVCDPGLCLVQVGSAKRQNR